MDQPPTRNKGETLQLGKGGMDDPSGAAPPLLDPPFLFVGFDFECILAELGSVPEHSPEALVAAIRLGSSVRFGCTERELCSSNLSPV